MITNQSMGTPSRHEHQEGLSDAPNHPDLGTADSPTPADSTPAEAGVLEGNISRLMGRYSPGYNLIITLGGIAFAEIIAMIVVYFLRDLPYYQQVLIDASIMTVIIFPIIYFLSFRPIIRHIQRIYQAELEVRKREQKEQALLQTIQTMQLDIARDLHDTIGQNISYLRMKLDHLSGKKSARLADLKTEMRNMAGAANETYDLLRGTLAILQSPHSSDLYRLFTRYAEQIEERARFKVECTSRGDPRPLSAPRMRQLFYIFREILNNIEKHANANRVTMEMSWEPESVSLEVSDNGSGFEMEQIQFGAHYGLKFMKERVALLTGTIAIHSTVGAGTTITVHIPYEQP